MDNSVERLHRALVDAIRQTRDDDFSRPVTVSEIYQQLVPYRTARSVVGFDMNADYEYALLRMLAGEGDLVRLEPAEVRELLRSELESANPEVSRFREYANCDVWVSVSAGSYAEPVARASELPGKAEAEERQNELDSPAVHVPPPPAPAVAAARSQQCAFCGGELPRGRRVKFCPHCGGDLSQRPCPSCGEVLEPRWRFCANCGVPVEPPGAEAN